MLLIAEIEVVQYQNTDGDDVQLHQVILNGASLAAFETKPNRGQVQRLIAQYRREVRRAGGRPGRKN